MTIGWPQGIILTIYLLKIGMSLSNSVRDNSNSKFIKTIIGMIINIGLLTWGGFFG